MIRVEDATTAILCRSGATDSVALGDLEELEVEAFQ
jgi:hypothetical protein